MQPTGETSQLVSAEGSGRRRSCALGTGVKAAQKGGCISEGAVLLILNADIHEHCTL